MGLHSYCKVLPTKSRAMLESGQPRAQAAIAMNTTAKHNDSACLPEALRFLQRGDGSRAADFDDVIPTEQSAAEGPCVLAHRRVALSFGGRSQSTSTKGAPLLLHALRQRWEATISVLRNFYCVRAKTFILTRSSPVQTITRPPFQAWGLKRNRDSIQSKKRGKLP